MKKLLVTIILSAPLAHAMQATLPQAGTKSRKTSPTFHSEAALGDIESCIRRLEQEESLHTLKNGETPLVAATKNLAIYLNKLAIQRGFTDEEMSSLFNTMQFTYKSKQDQALVELARKHIDLVRLLLAKNLQYDLEETLDDKPVTSPVSLRAQLSQVPKSSIQELTDMIWPYEITANGLNQISPEDKASNITREKQAVENICRKYQETEENDSSATLPNAPCSRTTKAALLTSAAVLALAVFILHS